MIRNTTALIGAAVVAVAASHASAGGIPALSIDVNIGDTNELLQPMGEFTEGGFLYERSFNDDPLTIDVAGGGVDVGWSWSADPSLGRGFGGPLSIMGGLTVQNNTGVTQTVSLLTTLPISSSITSSVIGGSVSATVTAGDASGATLSTSGGTAFYQGMIDGSVVGANAADLLPAPSTETVGAFLSGGLGPDSFGNPIPSQAAGAINTSIGIWITFDLTAGDSMSFTSVFVADIPGPSGAGLLLAAGVFASRRRR